jgi:hypothetical protein
MIENINTSFVKEVHKYFVPYKTLIYRKLPFVIF